MNQALITYVLMGCTILTSIQAWMNPRVMEDLIFYPPAVRRGQYYRFLGHGLIHLNVPHLLFNMFALWSFGTMDERCFSYVCMFGKMGGIVYGLLYLSALVVASIPDYIRHRDSYHYKALGASGAVTAVMFSTIMFAPQIKISLLFIPIGIPGWILGLIYLAVSNYLDRRGGSNIGHNAHFWGGIYGIIFTIVVTTLFTDIDIFEHFLRHIQSNLEKITFKCDG